jgi:hypothetical protein
LLFTLEFFNNFKKNSYQVIKEWKTHENKRWGECFSPVSETLSRTLYDLFEIDPKTFWEESATDKEYAIKYLKSTIKRNYLL